MKTTIYLTPVHLSRDYAYVELTKGQSDDLLKNNVSSQEQYTLSAANAQTFREYLWKQADDTAVPFTSQALTSVILGYALSPAAAGVAGTALSYVFDSLQGRAVKSRVLAEVVSSGGVLRRLAAISLDKQQHRSLVFALEYSVQVGSEPRHYVLSSCRYPTKTTIVEIGTVSALNNKILKHQGANTWRVFDVDGGKFEGDVLTAYKEDGDFIYLTSVEIPGNRIKTTYRVSLQDGPWQSQLPDGQWGTLYMKTQAR